MITITNAKVAGFAPRWAPFRGFSILFDNPGAGLTPARGIRPLACDVDGEPMLGLYRALRDTLADLDLDLLINTYLFCPLPPPSYHVTIWDGGNEGNADQVFREHRPALGALLAGLPEALSRPNELITTVAESPLATEAGEIRFRYDRLILWGHVGLVAALAPADAASANRLRQIEAGRQALSGRFRAAYGIAASERYTPHVTLGYFANREGAQLAVPVVGSWESRFAAATAGRTLAFSGASVYGFTDMATFFTGGVRAGQDTGL